MQSAFIAVVDQNFAVLNVSGSSVTLLDRTLSSAIAGETAKTSGSFLARLLGFYLRQKLDPSAVGLLEHIMNSGDGRLYLIMPNRMSEAEGTFVTTAFAEWLHSVGIRGLRVVTAATEISVQFGPAIPVQ